MIDAIESAMSGDGKRIGRVMLEAGVDVGTVGRYVAARMASEASSKGGLKWR